jgi:hypothetical protein
VTVRLLPVHETVIAVLAAICCVGVSALEGLLTDELAVAGRRAIVPETELFGATWGQAAATEGPEVFAPAVASAA